MLWAVSRAPLAKLQAYKRRMGWTFPWASSHGSDFNFDFNASFTKEQQRGTRIQLPARRSHDERGRAGTPVPCFDEWAAMAGNDLATYRREREGMSAFALEDGVVYTPIPPMCAEWTPCGACTCGLTARRRDATRPACGFAATTSMTASQARSRKQ
jgi:predicted dithiol-disulfide oxidoreductase (DUF899 family)